MNNMQGLTNPPQKVTAILKSKNQMLISAIIFSQQLASLFWSFN